MRVLSLLLASVFLIGCASTSVIDATWDDATVAEFNGRSSGQSIWENLDESVAASGFVVSPDTLLLKTDFGLGETPFPQNGEFVRRAGSEYFWRRLSPGDVHQVELVRFNRRRGLQKGMLVGAIAVGVPAALFGAVIQFGVCGTGDWGDCHGAMLVTSGIGSAAGGLVGGLIGAARGHRESTIYRFRRGSVSVTPGGAKLSVDLAR